MAYDPTIYVLDSPPALNATNLNKMEQGIYNNDKNISEIGTTFENNKLNNYVPDTISVSKTSHQIIGSHVWAKYTIPQNSLYLVSTRGTASKYKFEFANSNVVEYDYTTATIKGATQTIKIPNGALYFYQASQSSTSSGDPVPFTYKKVIYTTDELSVVRKIKTNRKNLLFEENITDNLQVQPYAFITDSDYCSAFIPIITGKTLYVNWSLGTPTIRFYDSNKSVLSGYDVATFSNAQVSRNVGYTIEKEGVAYLRLSWLKSRNEHTDYGTNTFDLFFSDAPIRFKTADDELDESIIPELNTGRHTNFWYMKIGDSLGDSLTGQGYFQSWTRRFFGLKNFYNHGVGGTRLSGPANSSGDSMWMDSRIEAIYANADFVTVLGGQNDGNVEIGEISKANTNTDTYAGALNVIINKLYARCGADVRIILCCPFWVPSEGDTNDRFNVLGEAVRGIAKLHGLPVADFGGLDSADYNNASRYWEESDRTHPLELLHKEKIAPILISTMQNINPIDWEKVNYYTES